ncbi:MAG: hypothetical protein NVS4B1_11380 [Ktedonobacteraceae bacterium]
MDKCPYCGAETRPGDNFCLNCGNRLVPTTFSAQSQPGIGEETQASPEEWNLQQEHELATVGATASSWSTTNDPPTVAAPTGESSTQRSAQALPTDGIEHPARFILRADDGAILQEYPLDKLEIAIGRAPNSDILLSKDKLTSRRHATVRYENGNYVLRDERSANGTFVNGQQIEEMVPRVLEEGDHVGIGEHELLFRSHGSASAVGVEDLPTIAVSPPAEMTYRTREDSLATMATSDQFGTKAMENGLVTGDVQQASSAPPIVQEPEVQPVAQVEEARAEEHLASNGSVMPESPVAVPGIPVVTSYGTPSTTSAEKEAASVAASAPPPVVNTPPVQSVTTMQAQSSNPSQQAPATTNVDTNVTFSRLTNVSQPSLPDMTALMAALSTLDGQVMSLQEQINATQDAMHNHDAEIAQMTNQLRAGVRRVAERMDNTIADVARSREALAWADLSQLMEDVMNNPRDIEYVTKLARKARELNKIFQIHQNVLNTMYECNSLLRGLIGEER